MQKVGLERDGDSVVEVRLHLEVAAHEELARHFGGVGGCIPTW